MQSPYSIFIKKVQKETRDCVSLEFDIPENLQEKFEFKPGQHLTFVHQKNGLEIRRTYSLCTCPDERKWKIAIKRLEKGYYSNLANDKFEGGEVLKILPPIGNFCIETNPENQYLYVAFAGGSGITPVISNLKAVLKREPQSRFILFYSNSTKDNIIFRDELESLKNQYLERFSLFHILTRERQNLEWFDGRMDLEKIQSYSSKIFNPHQVHKYLLCGPYNMVELIRQYLLKIGVDKEDILTELFYVPITAEKPVREKIAVETPDPDSDAEWGIIYGGHTYRISSPDLNRSILDEARSHGIDLPYACKGGVCGSCKAKLIKGKVDMKNNFALVEEELRKGFVLTCQSNPKSTEITLDFDTRS